MQLPGVKQMVEAASESYMPLKSTPVEDGYARV